MTSIVLVIAALLVIFVVIYVKKKMKSLKDSDNEFSELINPLTHEEDKPTEPMAAVAETTQEPSDQSTQEVSDVAEEPKTSAEVQVLDQGQSINVEASASNTVTGNVIPGVKFEFVEDGESNTVATKKKRSYTRKSKPSKKDEKKPVKKTAKKDATKSAKKPTRKSAKKQAKNAK